MKPEEQKPVQKTLEDLVKEKREERKATRQVQKNEAKKPKKEQKESGSKITIIVRKPSYSVLIKGLPRNAKEADIQEVIFNAVHIKNIPVKPSRGAWIAEFNSENKAEQLISALNGGECQESK